MFAASDDGERVGEVADLLRVSVPYASKVLTRRRTTGKTTARTQRGHKPPKQVGHLANTLAIVRCGKHPIAQILRLGLAPSYSIPACGPTGDLDHMSPPLRESPPRLQRPESALAGAVGPS